MPDLKFSLDLGAFVQPLLLLCFALVVNQARKAVITHLDKRHDETETNVNARHAETTLHLDRIEAQTTATNGRVIVLETEHKADHDLLMTVVGKVEVLTGKQA